jgi:hypothetical protein
MSIPAYPDCTLVTAISMLMLKPLDRDEPVHAVEFALETGGVLQIIAFAAVRREHLEDYSDHRRLSFRRSVSDVVNRPGDQMLYKVVENDWQHDQWMPGERGRCEY